MSSITGGREEGEEEGEGDGDEGSDKVVSIGTHSSRTLMEELLESESFREWMLCSRDTRLPTETRCFKEHFLRSGAFLTKFHCLSRQIHSKGGYWTRSGRCASTCFTLFMKGVRRSRMERGKKGKCSSSPSQDRYPFHEFHFSHLLFAWRQISDGTVRPSRR